MVDERTLDKWLALDMSRLQRAFVSQPRPVGDLLLEETPAAPTRGGELHHYDTATLRRIGDALSPLARRKVRLPATFYVEKDLAEDAYLADEPAMELLRALGEIPAAASAREGKLWLGHARARLIAERYPGAFQFVLF